MNHIEFEFLLRRLQHIELIREAELERMSKSISKKQSSTSRPENKIINRIQARLAVIKMREQNPRERQYLPVPSCTVTESQTK